MSFKESLLEKIEIDRLADAVAASLGPAESGRKVDRQAMRKLLGKSPFSHERHRDLDLFINDTDGSAQILVLDNDLAIYRTTVDDVVMRKSPTVREMINIRNIVKILNDADVIESKKERSVRTVQKTAVARLDLSFDASDIDDIRREGAASLENKYAEGITESLEMLTELLGYRNAPESLQGRHRHIIGRFSGETAFGPVVIYNPMENTVQLIDREMEQSDARDMQDYHDVIRGKTGAPVEGEQVFTFLADAVKRQQL